MLPAVIVIDTAVPRGDVTLTAPAAATLRWRLEPFLVGKRAAGSPGHRRANWNLS